MKLFRKSCSSVESGQTESCHFKIAPPHQLLRAPIVFTTRFSWVLGCSSVNLNSVLGPGGHTSLGYSTAAGQAGHLAKRKDPVPKTHLGQLSNQGLGWVKTSTQGILETTKNKLGGLYGASLDTASAALLLWEILCSCFGEIKEIW